MQNQQPLPMDYETRKVTRTLTIKLNHVEKAQCIDEINDIKDKQRDVEHEFEQKKSEYKASITDLDNRVVALLKKARDGEARNTECEERLFFANNVVQTWNGDEMVEERQMSENERQPSLSLETQHGVVMEPTDAARDLQEVMREERSATKAVAT